VAESNLDETGRPPRAPGSQEINAEELLAELVRLVDSSGLAPERPPPVETSKQKIPDAKSAHSPEVKTPVPSFEAPSRKAKEAAVGAVQPLRASRSDNSHPNEPKRIAFPESPRSGAWRFWVLALILVSGAAIGAAFWLESELSEGPALIAAAQSPTPVQPPSNLGVATPSGAEASPQRNAPEPPEGTVSSKEAPIDPNARASLENSPTSQDSGQTAGGGAQPAIPPAGEPLATPVNRPGPAATSAPAAPESPDSKAAPAASLPSGPTPAATPAPSAAATDSGVAAHASDAPLPPVRPATKAAVQGAGLGQRSTAKPDLPPAKLSSQSGAHALAKAETTGPGAPPSVPVRRAPSANLENKAKTLETAQASVPPQAAQPQAAPSQQPKPAAQQPNPNLVARAFGSVAGVVGAVAGLIPFVGH